MKYNFINPRTPSYKKGLLVIDSDDGNIGDYTHWYPITKAISMDRNQWIGDDTVVICPSVNTSTIGTQGKLTIENLQFLVSRGWEITSHGTHHYGIGELPLATPVEVGATSLDIDGAGQIRVEGGYSFRIFEGEKEDVFVPISPVTLTSTYGVVTMQIDTPLTNSYTTNARIQLTDESAELLLQGCIDTLASWGIECKHHVYTYHSGSQHMFSQKAVDWIKQYFVSGRGIAAQNVNQKETIKLENLNSLSMGNTYEQIDAALDETASTGGLFVFYGHGETIPAITDKLKYLINGALDRGIRITTRTKALKMMGLMP